MVYKTRRQNGHSRGLSPVKFEKQYSNSGL